MKSLTAFPGSVNFEDDDKAVRWGAAASWAPCCPLLWVSAHTAAMLHLLDSRRRTLRRER